jgi:hypothetical protein
MSAKQPVQQRLVAFWGVLGVMAIVLFAIVRLTPFVISALEAGLDVVQWIAFAVNIIVMAWSEGYRGFQSKFSPRVVARALYLYRHPASLGTQLCAPLFCIGYFDACRRTKVGAWVGTTGIVILILLVHQLEQPWRGIVDAGVVVGLSWGLISLIVMAVKTFSAGEYLVSPKVPDRYNNG